MLVLAPACQRPEASSTTTVVAGAYPLAEVARAIAGSDLSVRDLTPAGAEPHDLELSPRDTDLILSAALVVYVGAGFQPAVARTAAKASRSLDVLSVVDSSDGDPHVWLDPIYMSELVDGIESSLADASPSLDADFRERAAKFKAQLVALDGRWREGLADCQRRSLVTAHAAFGHLARRYNLQQVAIAGASPETEPNPRRIDEVIDLVRSTGVTTIFTEDLVSPAVANTVARETGTKTAVLDPLESAQPVADPGYIARMDANLARLRAALECR